MNYCIVNSENIIENIIVADADFAESIGALPYYEGAGIGDEYSPPAPVVEPTTEERLTALEEALAQTDETAIALYEAQAEQEAINAAQDEALIEIYEMMEG